MGGMMANFLDAVIKTGPNKGMTIRELLTMNIIVEDGTGVLRDIRRTAASTDIAHDEGDDNGDS